MEIIKNPTKQAIDYLSERLNIPELDEYSQDWECEAADSSRINDFVEFYKNNTLTDVEKYTLMSLIINSCNDAISEKNLIMNFGVGFSLFYALIKISILILLIIGYVRMMNLRIAMI